MTRLRASSIPALSDAEAIGYSAGNLGKNAVWNSLEFCLLFILTDIVGLPPTTAGAMIMVSIGWDALLDPIVGIWADKVRTRWGKYGPFLLLGAPACGLSFVAIFAVPLLPVAGKPVLMLLALLVFRACYTLVDLPHNALIACITSSSRERSRISGLRYLFSSVSSLLISVSLVPIQAAMTGPTEARRFLGFAIGVAVVSTVALWISWWSVRRFDLARSAVESVPPRCFVKFGSLLRNRSLLVLLGVVMLTGLATPMFTKTVLYFARYTLGVETWGGRLLTAFSVGSLLATWGWVQVSHRWNKAFALQLAHGGVILGSAGFLLAPADPGAALLVLAAAIGAASAGAFMLIWAMAPDVVENHEWQSGTRLEASVFALLVLAMKSAIGLGGGLTGLLLERGGFVAGVPQSAATLAHLKQIMCGLPALGAVGIILLLWAYPITHDSHAATVHRLERRRSHASV